MLFQVYGLRGKMITNSDWVAIWKEEFAAYLKAPYYLDTNMDRLRDLRTLQRR
jgi:hypothetical protein